MKDKRVKWLTLVGGMIAILVLVILIGRSFQKEPNIKTVPMEESQSKEDVVQNPEEIETTDKEDSVAKEGDEVKEVQVTVAPILTKVPEQEAIDAGTDQKIQEDISSKPTYSEEELTDPAKKPNGEEVTPKPEDKKVTPTPKPEKNEDKKEDKKVDKKDDADNNSSGGLPGFDDVPDGGPNEIIYGDSDGDIDKQVGSMD